MRQHAEPKHKLTNREVANILGREDLKAKSQARSKLAKQEILLSAKKKNLNSSSARKLNTINH